MGCVVASGSMGHGSWTTIVVAWVVVESKKSKRAVLEDTDWQIERLRDNDKSRRHRGAVAEDART